MPRARPIAAVTALLTVALCAGLRDSVPRQAPDARAGSSSPARTAIDAATPGAGPAAAGPGDAGSVAAGLGDASSVAAGLGDASSVGAGPVAVGPGAANAADAGAADAGAGSAGRAAGPALREPTDAGLAAAGFVLHTSRGAADETDSGSRPATAAEVEALRKHVQSLEAELVAARGRGEALTRVESELSALRNDLAQARAAEQESRAQQQEEQQQTAQRRAQAVAALRQVDAALAGGNFDVDEALAAAQASLPGDAALAIAQARAALNDRNLLQARALLAQAIGASGRSY